MFSKADVVLLLTIVCAFILTVYINMNRMSERVLK